MMIIFSKVLFWSLCNNFIRYFETIYWFISNFSHIKSVSKGKLKDGWYENRTSTRKISDSNVNIQLWISVILSCPPFLFFWLCFNLSRYCKVFTMFTVHALKFQYSKWNSIKFNTLLMLSWCYIFKNYFSTM